MMMMDWLHVCFFVDDDDDALPLCFALGDSGVSERSNQDHLF